MYTFRPQTNSCHQDRVSMDATNTVRQNNMLLQNTTTVMLELNNHCFCFKNNLQTEPRSHNTHFKIALLHPFVQLSGRHWSWETELLVSVNGTWRWSIFQCFLQHCFRHLPFPKLAKTLERHSRCGSSWLRA